MFCWKLKFVISVNENGNRRIVVALFSLSNYFFYTFARIHSTIKYVRKHKIRKKIVHFCANSWIVYL
jgi:hypothetical protein